MCKGKKLKSNTTAGYFKWLLQNLLYISVNLTVNVNPSGTWSDTN